MWWQKCTRSGRSDRIRRSEARQAARRWPGRPGGRTVWAARIAVHQRGVGRVADQHVEGVAVAADQDALVALGMPRGGDDLEAGQHLGVSVEQFESCAREVDPVAQLRRLTLGPAELSALDEERGVGEDGVLAAVVEVQMSVDHQVDVCRAHVELGQRVGHRPVDHAPVVQHVLRAAHAGVDQHRATVMGDHEPVHRPALAARAAQAGQMQALDLQWHPFIVRPPLTGGQRITAYLDRARCFPR